MSCVRHTILITLCALGCGGREPATAIDASTQIDAAGRPQEVLASGRSNPGPIALDETTVYFIDLSYQTQIDDGLVLAMPLGGGSIRTLASRQRSLSTLATDGTYVYWTTGTPCLGCVDGEVKRVLRNGGSSVEVLASAQNLPSSVLVANGYVYWTNQGRVSGSGTLNRLQLGGQASVEVLLPDSFAPTALAADATHLYWASCGSLADTMNGTAHYNSDGMIRSRPLAGGAVQTLATGQPCPFNVAVTGSHVFWMNIGTAAQDFADAGLMMVDLAGGAPSRVSSWQGMNVGMAADARSVYWMDVGVHEAAGSEWMPSLFADPGIAFGLSAYIAINDTHLYFTTGVIDGSVRRAAR